MDRSDVLTLITETTTQDDNGVWQKAETTTDIFCQASSVTRDEFFSAGRSGLNPEYRFTVFGPDYDGQKIVSYNGARYAVYRTYKARTDELELYVERKGGTITAPEVEDG